MKTSRSFSELKKPNELASQFLDDRLTLKIKQARDLEQLLSKTLQDLNNKNSNDLFLKIAEVIKDHSLQSMHLNANKTRELLSSLSYQLQSAKAMKDASLKDKAIDQALISINSFLAISKEL